MLTQTHSLPVIWTDDREAVRDLQSRAASIGSKFAQCGGSCAVPRQVRLAVMASLTEPAASICMAVRCRRCPPCLRYRARLWAQKGMAEVRAGQRTWFGTLTVRPETRFMYRLTTDQRLLDAGRQSWSDAEWFREHVKDLGREVTLFLKRLRKNSGAKIRYLLVAERHKDGYPHFHVLIHEIRGSEPVTKRCLEAAWQAGFSNWRLVSSDNPRVVYYVTKYLTKSALTRVRASFRYGRDAVHRLTELVFQATRRLGQGPDADAISVNATTSEGTPPPQVETSTLQV